MKGSIIHHHIAGNHAILMKFEQEASKTAYLEAFLESAPQFILQCSIVLRTGKYGKECYNIDLPRYLHSATFILN